MFPCFVLLDWDGDIAGYRHGDISDCFDAAVAVVCYGQRTTTFTNESKTFELDN